MPQAFQVAKSLIKKDGSGKTKFSVPTSDQVGKLINSGEAVLDILQKIISFADEKKKRFPTLETLPIGKDDVDKLGDELKTIEKLPYT